MNSCFKEYQTRLTGVLDQALSNGDVPARLLESMRYSTLAGGKRLRAMLVYAAGEAVNAPLDRLDPVAVALECMHSYSLIHDDLPVMDDDDLRRGQPSNHVQYDQATAILAGDALQTLAFEVLSSPDSALSDQQNRLISHKLARSSGQVGMVGGQILDLLATDKDLKLADLENIHRRKTGALISAAVVCGGLCAEQVNEDCQQKLRHYADSIGLAFQVMDDVLDIRSSTKELGKPSGADIALGKSTYPALIGLQESVDLSQNLYQQAIDTLSSIGDNTQMLEDLAAMVVNRSY
jgi:geranylgeranyl pyrophosphate synthase